MNAHSLVKFQTKTIETTVTNMASVAEDWIQHTNQNGTHKIISLTCKFIHHPVTNKIALLQLCHQTKCLLLQLLHMDSIPHSLRDFLTDSTTTFVGIHIQENSHKLLQEYGLRVNRVLDLHFMANKWFPFSYSHTKRPSLRALAFGVVGFPKRICRRDCSSHRDWESRVLDIELIEQASVDAYTSYNIAHKLLREG